LKMIVLGVFIALTLLFSAYSWWYLQQMKADPVAQLAMISSDSVEVENTNLGISFIPLKYSEKFLIFYPGAFVDPVAYAPLCHELAGHGIECLIVKMPLRSAIFGYDAPSKMSVSGKLGKEFILAGHSHGAEMAAHYVNEKPGRIAKLILLGTQYPEKISLADNKIKVLKVYGTNDGLEPVSEVEKNKVNLPAGTRYVEIAGGNHGQFGYYGKQPFDDPATISREKQQKQTVQAMLAFIFD
ncbi:MAG: alpha/beta hydrolase, partial [Bacteroidia bacterium]